MFDPSKLKFKGLPSEINISMEDLSFITPNDRKVLFDNLIENYQALFPTLELYRAYLNFDSHMLFDYYIVFKDTNRPDIIVFDFVLQYTPRTLPGYKKCILDNNVEGFFKMCNDRLYKMPLNIFKKALSDPRFNLSWSEKSDRYWLSKDNERSLTDFFLEISRCYVHGK